MALNNRPPTPLSRKFFHNLSQGTRSYAFSRSTKHTKRSLPYSQDFLKICFRVKIWSVVLRPGRKPHWSSFPFDFSISRHFLSRHLAFTFPSKLRSQTTCWISCLAKVSKVARNILPDGDQLTIQHFALLERPANQKTNLANLCKNLLKILDRY